LRATTSSSKVSLVNTYLLNCSSIYEPTSTSTLLYSGGSSTNNGVLSSAASNAGFALLSNVANQANFVLNATSELYPVATDSFASMVISCWIGVEYQDVVTSKRNVLQINSLYRNDKKVAISKQLLKRDASSSQQMSTSARFSVVKTVEQTAQPSEENGANSFNNIQLFFLISAFLLFFVNLY